MSKAPVSVVVLTYNEEDNIAECLESLVGWAGEVFVVDSFSTDSTVEIARQYTDNVVEHPFEHYAAQRNWAQQSLPFSYDWVFHVDADERVTPALADEICDVLEDAPANINGYLVKERSLFMGRWIKHGGMYPVYHMRLFRREAGRCEDRQYDQHYVCDGKVAKLEADLIEENNIDLTDWTARHNRWSTAEALEALMGGETAEDADIVEERLFGTPIERRRWLKNKLFYKTPELVRPFLYFGYRYFLQKGFLDGKEGLIYHVLQGFWFRFLVDAKIYEAEQKGMGEVASSESATGQSSLGSVAE